MSQHVVRRLRPYLFTSFKFVRSGSNKRAFACSTPLHAEKAGKDETKDYKRRIAQLEETRGALSECYPRLDIVLNQRTSVKDFRNTYADLEANDTREDRSVTVAGKL